MTGIAFAAAPAAGGAPGGILGGLLPFILIFVVFYFLLIMPQQKKAKKHQEFLKNLKKGDAVITTGGLYGEITGITDTVVTLEITDNIRVKVSRAHILGSAASAAQAEGGAKSGGG
ncbi:MAG: preprotein translocase subunit YajC [Proteobacteria bacterium]|nr:preprotein translocase subunit YajC [Pseudomonadota bacterium]MBU1711053.1 preprotein translocase subunit YajC [Pseudomonadota bacterium]